MTDLRRFLDGLTSLAIHDYVLCFLSRRYLRSPYCMAELLALSRQPLRGQFPYGRFQLYLFPGTGLDRAGGFPKDSLFPWKTFWAQECQKREKGAESLFPGPRKWQNRKDHLHSHAAHSWYEFIEHQHNRDSFALQLVHHRFFKPLRTAATATAVQETAGGLLEEVHLVLSEPGVLIEQIAVAKEGGRMDDGVSLYLRLRCLRDDYHVATDQDRLHEEPEDMALLEYFRQRAIEATRAPE